MSENESTVLVDAEYLHNFALTTNSSGPFVNLALKYAENAERHVTHLLTLLEEHGITCICDLTHSSADPDCPIHVYGGI